MCLIRSRLIKSVFACLLLCTGAVASNPGSLPQASGDAGDVKFISADELKAKIAKGEKISIMDVRSTEAFNSSVTKIKGSFFMRYRRIHARLRFAPLKDIPKDREFVTYCSCPHDESAMLAAQVLSSAGYKNVRVLKDGWSAWQKAGGQVETKAKAL